MYWMNTSISTYPATSQPAWLLLPKGVGIRVIQSNHVTNLEVQLTLGKGWRQAARRLDVRKVPFVGRS